MSILKIAVIVGTRPEVIKVWPVIEEARRIGVEICLVSTNQQEKLLNETFSNLGISTQIDLKIQNKTGNLNNFISECINKCQDFLISFKPDFVIVQGDTASALSGAIAAHNLRIKIGHIEAGLRSGDMENPWPEEGYRRIIDSISSILWVPTPEVCIQIQGDQKLLVVGNTSIDALRMACAQVLNSNEQGDTIVVTLHRRESFGNALENTLKNILMLSQQVANKIVFIQHPNPNVQAAMDAVDFESGRIEIIEPVPYLEFVAMISESALIISDSGGLQEEATALEIPLLIVREKTERLEAVTQGGCIMVGNTGEKIVEESIKLLAKNRIAKESGILNSIFGDGHAATRIIASLLS